MYSAMPTTKPNRQRRNPYWYATLIDKLAGSTLTNGMDAGTVTIGMIHSMMPTYPAKQQATTMARPVDPIRANGTTRKGNSMYIHHSVLMDHDACTHENQLCRFID